MWFNPILRVENCKMLRVGMQIRIYCLIHCFTQTPLRTSILAMEIFWNYIGLILNDIILLEEKTIS